MAPEVIPSTVIISPRDQALEEANTPRGGQVMWSDGSRLENGRVGVAAIGLNVLKIWKSKKSVFEDNKEIFNVKF